jgi:hypothetical protein
MDRIFKSKVDWWFHGVVLLLCVSCVILIVRGAEIWAILVMFFCTYMSIHTLLNTWYKLTADGFLIVHCSFFPEKRIAVSEITAVESSFLPVSSYALSLDRIIIWKGNLQWLLISPVNKQEFVNVLRRMNPNIKIIK